MLLEGLGKLKKKMHLTRRVSSLRPSDLWHIASSRSKAKEISACSAVDMVDVTCWEGRPLVYSAMPISRPSSTHKGSVPVLASRALTSKTVSRILPR
jgi:uncharacterized protein (UPF0261 family)